MGRRVQDDLEGRQALLSVDHVPDADVGGRSQLLVQHDGTQKVRRNQRRAIGAWCDI